MDFNVGNEPSKASINIDYLGRNASIKIDQSIYNDKKIPEGCKVFMIFHEIGHLIFGSAEEMCDRFAFYHSLRAGVSPFLCYATIRAYMPEHYNYRIEEMFKNLMAHQNLKNDYEIS